MYKTCVDPALMVLKRLIREADDADADADADADLMFKESCRATYQDLRFLKMFILGMACHDDWYSGYDLSNMRRKLKSTGELFEREIMFTNWKAVIYHARKQIELYKPLVKQICISLLGALIEPFQFEELFSEYGSTMLSFIDLIFDNLRVLDSSFDLFHSVKQQFHWIERSFKVFGKFGSHISCLACLHWIDEIDPKFLKSDMESMLSDMMMRYTPFSPEVTTLYLDLFKDSGDHEFKRSVCNRLTVSYAEFLLDHLFVSKSLRDRFVVWSSFLMDHSGENINLLEDTFEFFSSMLYNVTALSSYFIDCPKIDAIGFLDSSLANLEKILDGKIDIIPTTKHEVELVRKQLVLIRPIVLNKLKVLNKEDKLKDLWSQIMNMLYYASYVVKLCLMRNLYSLYGSIYVPHVIETIKLVRSEIEKIEDNLKYDIKGTVTTGMELTQVSSSVLLPQATSSRYEGPFIGYEKDAEEILNHLLRGTKDLRIICISGMAGQGKTTLAKKIYNDSSISYHFHKKVWCYVSKECNPKEVLANIVGGDGTYIAIHELADYARKSLKGRRYFIVLDDIWDVEVWNGVQSVFPNDGNGSRILFTSRNHDLASKAESNSLSHRLRPFSNEECWELLKKKLSNCDGIPGECLEVGNIFQIFAKVCLWQCL